MQKVSSLTHLKTGIGYDCAGQIKVALFFEPTLIASNLSPKFTFGLTLPTGSKKFYVIQ